MKHIFILAAILVLALASVSWGVVQGSKHDLSDSHPTAGVINTESGNGTDEICVFCHTPHNSGTAAPLWNRTLPANGGYTPYTSSTMDATMTGTLNGMSLACLSCHDGTVALDALTNFPNYVGGEMADADMVFTGADVNAATEALNAGNAYFSTDLSNDHPISIRYDDAGGVAGEMFASNGTNLVNTSGIYNDMQLFDDGAGNWCVECASCHDVHNNAGATVPAFLVHTNTQSRLCRSCHNK